MIEFMGPTLGYRVDPGEVAPAKPPRKRRRRFKPKLQPMLKVRESEERRLIEELRARGRLPMWSGLVRS